MHAFVVPIRQDGRPAPGVRIEDDGLKMGLNGVDNGKLWFDQVRVPREALLNRFADVSEDGTYSSDIENPNRRFFTMLGTLIQGRVCVGGAGINASKVALAIAIRYALRRRQFEATSEDEEELLLDYGQHQRRLFPLLAHTYALHFAQEVVAGQCHQVFSGEVDDEKFVRELESRAAGTKALGTWHATHTIQECREACGGAGYLAGEPVRGAQGGHRRVHHVRGRQHGPAPAGRQGAAHRLLLRASRTSTSSGWSGSSPGSRSRPWSSGRACTSSSSGSATCCPAATSGTRRPGLLDPQYQLAMLRFREEHMLAGVARRLKRGIDEGMNPGEVFSLVQDHVIHAARAHVERLVLEAFVEKVGTLEDGDNKVALSLLCDLHALATIEADRAWFMEHGRLTGSRSKAISREINELCRKVRPLARDLVDAFGVPEEMLRSKDLVG